MFVESIQCWKGKRRDRGDAETAETSQRLECDNDSLFTIPLFTISLFTISLFTDKRARENTFSRPLIVDKLAFD